MSYGRVRVYVCVSPCARVYEDARVSTIGIAIVPENSTCITHMRKEEKQRDRERERREKLIVAARKSEVIKS